MNARRLCPDCHNGKTPRKPQPGDELPCAKCRTPTLYLAPRATMKDLFEVSRALKRAVRDYTHAARIVSEDGQGTGDENLSRLALSERALELAALAFAEIKAARKVTK